MKSSDMSSSNSVGGSVDADRRSAGGDVDSERRSAGGNVDSERRSAGDASQPDGSSAARASSAAGRNAAAVVGLLALIASALIGGNALGLRERLLGSETPVARPAAGSRASGGAGEAPAAATAPSSTVLRSQPWWQGVTTAEGSGSMSSPGFSIGADAIQWRVESTCQTGRLLARVPGVARPVLDVACPASATGYSTRKGSVSLEVTADGPWQIRVDQQVDVPLVEPPLPAMTAPGAVTVATGSVYRVDQVGMGTATVYRLPDASYALRLEDFFVTPNTDLELQLSPLEAPRTTEEVTDARSGTIASLDVTAGAMNFRVPPGLDPTQYKSLVIWCELTRNAYAAVSLKPV